jgi:hypothetical protein
MKKLKNNKTVSMLLICVLGLSSLSLFSVGFSAPVAGQAGDAQDNTLTPIPAKGSSTQPLDAGDTVAAQDKAVNFIENVLLVDLSKYAIELKNSDIMEGIPLANDNRTITTLIYALTPLDGNDEKDVISVSFTFEKDVLTGYFTLPLTEVITNTQYDNRNAVVQGFLEKYQTYTNIDSTNLIAMLDNVDLTKESVITKEDTKLVVKGADLRWTYTVNGVDYTTLTIGLIGGFVRSVSDTRALYTIGDTSVNISMEQAVDIAIKNLQSYSYEMSDGSIVQNFKVNKDATMAELVVTPVDYELRPYWDIKMFLDEVYPGNVFGVTVFLWANTGEVISVSNMATGGANSGDSATETVPSPVDTASSESDLTQDKVVSDLLVPLGVVAAIIAAVAVSVVAVKKRKQQRC